MTIKLLDLVAEFCRRRNLGNPGSVVASGDDGLTQLWGLCNECLTDITSRGTAWPRLRKEATFTSLAQEDQGLIATIAPYGFKYLMPDTFFDRTQRVPIYGPRNGPTWQANEALPSAGPYSNFRIWQGHLYLQPAPAAGHDMHFEYASDMAVLANDGVTWRKRFAADDDVFQLDEDLLFLGLHWRWRREQGLSYNQEKLDYEALMAQSMGNTSDKGDINMGDGDRRVGPTIMVPAGNWRL